MTWFIIHSFILTRLSIYVKLSSFGNFETKDKKARPGRNPKTGVEVEISSRRVVTFHAGQKLKSAVQEQMDK